MYIIDSNTCIYFMNGKYESVRDKFLSVSPKDIKISSVVKAELLLGAFKSQTREQTTKKVEKFLEPFEVIDFSDAMAYDYAKIRATLEKSGNSIGANDLLIAATALNKRATVVTHNISEFSRVQGLVFEDWVTD